MKKILYVDNFRGFSDTYIPIEDVNFLVGENSTGKTSILSLIALFDTMNFWVNQDFNTEFIELGLFKDIVSVKSSDKSHFKIGIIIVDDDTDISQNQSEENKFHPTIMMVFENHQGNPRLSQYYLHGGDIQLIFNFYDNQIRFYCVEKELSNDPNENTLRIFYDWIESYSENIGPGYTILQYTDFLDRISVLAITQYLVQIASKKGKFSRKNRFTNFKPQLFDNFSWMGPIRSEPKRTYDRYKISYSPAGDHSPYLISQNLEKKKTKEKFLRFFEKYGKDSGLFDSIGVEKLTREKTSPFRLYALMGDVQLTLKNLGYGISQILPIMTEIYSITSHSCISLQQPEVHLHPRAQASVGDMIFDLAMKDQKKFLIETHSDYIIDRFRINLCKSKEADINSQIIYFEKSDNGNEINIIKILNSGEYFGKGIEKYKAFFINEAVDLLGL